MFAGSETMKQLGYIRIFFQALIFPLLPYKKRKKIQKRRLKKLVRHVKANSPYFARLYKDIGEDFNLSDLPITTKEMMMENFDDWITDSSINWMQVDEFKRDKSNIGRRIKNKYMVAETSGSTGYPATMLHDKTHQNVESVLLFWIPGAFSGLWQWLAGLLQQCFWLSFQSCF